MLAKPVARSLVLLVLGTALSGCGLSGLASLGETPEGGEGRFLLREEAPRDKSLRKVSQQLQKSGEIKRAVERLNERLRLPEDVKLIVRSCKDGSSYDPEKQEIQFCLEDVVEVRELTADDPADERALTERGFVNDNVNHEAAHALLDLDGIAFTGREEDVADQFSAYMSMRQGDAGLDDLESAAYLYELSAHEYEQESADEHANDAQRAINYQCYVYGAKKRDSAHLISKKGLTKARAEYCWEEWEDLRDGWHQLLGQAGALR